MTPLEQKVEDKLINAVKAVGGLCIKLPASWYKGIPDRMVLLPGGRIFFLELKRSGKKPARHQVRYRKILRSLGFICDTITGIREMEQWINEHV